MVGRAAAAVRVDEKRWIHHPSLQTKNLLLPWVGGRNLRSVAAFGLRLRRSPVRGRSVSEPVDGAARAQPRAVAIRAALFGTSRVFLHAPVSTSSCPCAVFRPALLAVSGDFHG